MDNQWINVEGEGKTCCKIRKHSNNWGVTGTSICGKPAIWANGEKHYCQHHSLKGRFVFRDGDTGPIKARFDTKDELFANISNHPGMTMQHLSKSKRHDIAFPSLQTLKG